MPTTLTTSAGKTTLTIRISAEAVLMNTVLDNVSRLLYAQVSAPEGQVLQLYADLTQAQKLALINEYVKGKLIALHRYQVRQAAIAVSDAANTATLE